MTTEVSRTGAEAGQLPQAAAQPRGMADPAAWAVTAFATTSFMLGMYNSGWLNLAGVGIVIPAAFFFAGAIQIIVAILEVAHGNLFGAVVFGSYGPFWVIYGSIGTLYSVPAAHLASGLALFLSVFAVLSFIFTVAALRIDAVLVAILGLVTIGLALLAVGVGDGLPGVVKAGGWVTLVFAVLSWYYAAAHIFEATFGRKVLPLGSLQH